MNSRIQHHARARALASADSVRSGPFVLRYNRGWASPFANYAIPDDGAAPTADDVTALIDAFRERDRLPRLEYLPSCAPLVEAALLAAGLTVENRVIVMACTAETLVAPDSSPGVVCREPDGEGEFLAAALVQHLGYGGAADAEGVEEAARGADRLHATAADGGFVALAATGTPNDVGTVVGTGTCTPPLDGLSELVGLAVDSDFRRCGIAAALAAHLTAAALTGGCRLVWLEPGDADIQRIYARIGYRAVGEKLNISLR